jgi:hypothetical protein
MIPRHDDGTRWSACEHCGRTPEAGVGIRSRYGTARDRVTGFGVGPYVGSDLQVDVHAGHDFPDNLADYNLIIRCGACVTNRRQVLRRFLHAKRSHRRLLQVGCHT